MFRTDGETNRRRRNAAACKLLSAHLRMRRAGRMDDQRFDVGYIGKQGEYLQVVDELLRFLLTALDFKGEDAAGTVGEELLIQLMVRM